MPDLGSYGAEVISAYGATASLLLVLVVSYVLRARRAARELEAAEMRQVEDL